MSTTAASQIQFVSLLERRYTRDGPGTASYLLCQTYRSIAPIPPTADLRSRYLPAFEAHFEVCWFGIEPLNLLRFLPRVFVGRKPSCFTCLVGLKSFAPFTPDKGVPLFSSIIYTKRGHSPSWKCLRASQFNHFQPCKKSLCFPIQKADKNSLQSSATVPKQVLSLSLELCLLDFGWTASASGFDQILFMTSCASRSWR